jgi:phosphoglycolate phosphatase
MYETVLFDLDGTIIDSAEGIMNSFEYTFRKLGLPVPAREEMGVFIGPPLHYSFETICGLGAEGAARAVEAYREYFSEKGIYESRVYEGIGELLRALKENGKRLLIATSKYELYARQILERLGFSGFFDLIVGSEKDGGRSTKKEVIEYALAFAAVKKEAAVMVGDRMHDTVGAREAGIDSIGILYGFGSEEELVSGGATHIAPTPADIYRIICEK